MAWINRCLKSCGDYPVIVVDNASEDGTVDFIRSSFPDVYVIDQDENLGFGAANNIGIRYALDKEADFVFLLNQDAYLQPDTIENLIEVYSNNEVFGVISPIHLNGTGSALDKNFSFYLKQNDKLLFDFLCKESIDVYYSVNFVNAAAWLLPRGVLEEVGGFDPIFYHYGEDDNYCQRVLFHGFKVVVIPNAFIYHDREHRAQKLLGTNSEKLTYKERQLKQRWANLNDSHTEEINENINRTKRLLVKLLIKFQFKKFSYYRVELEMLKRLAKETFKSKAINKNKGRHYL